MESPLTTEPEKKETFMSKFAIACIPALITAGLAALASIYVAKLDSNKLETKIINLESQVATVVQQFDGDISISLGDITAQAQSAVTNVTELEARVDNMNEIINQLSVKVNSPETEYTSTETPIFSATSSPTAKPSNSRIYSAIDGYRYQTYDYVQFGKYTHDDRINPASPIIWKVLWRNDDELLLLATNADIMNMRYDEQDGFIGLWQDTTLYKYLNDVFIQGAFTDDERNNIKEDGNGLVRLLTIEEVGKLEYGFVDESSRRLTYYYWIINEEDYDKAYKTYVDWGIIRPQNQGTLAEFSVLPVITLKLTDNLFISGTGLEYDPYK
jgi:hypothetical protein